MTNQITAQLFETMIQHGSAALNLEKQMINDLNVFPVPDGDTGTNMGMTIQAAAAEFNRRHGSTVGESASIAASALLRGARGNSGVILSLLFRGISKNLKGKTEAGPAEFAAALQDGVTAAYSAVMKPAEGTILTVSRLAAKHAMEAAEKGADLEGVFLAAIEQGEITLAETTNMNPVLKKAGVVDAGGMGFLVIVKGMLAALRGEPMPEANETDAQENTIDYGAIAAEEITFTFDTVFIIRKNDPDVDLEPLRKYLNSIGDSLVIGEDDEAFKVHVHTDIPGNALNEGQKYGTLELAKIENMRTQADDMAAGRKTQNVDDLDHEDAPHSDEPVIAPAEKPFGYLAVCAGDGLAAMFRDLGVDAVVSGGQTMNPSTESILNAVNSVPAETVFVLPNNKNIIMAAEQCAHLTEKKVIVIPTATVPQGITAMMNVDFEAESAEVIRDAMLASRETVSTAQITYAARNSDFDGFTINEGDYLALLENKLFGTDHDIAGLLQGLAEKAAEKSAEFISLYFGEDVSEDDANAAAEVFRTHCPDAEVSVFSGGQPVYYYIISVE
ncbi:MAG: DAK2 domain-containing protein [Oscillospiraceae bacterium]|nr:DAK2 domain-containing protein [Oscillospiraceae bacterium]